MLFPNSHVIPDIRPGVRHVPKGNEDDKSREASRTNFNKRVSRTCRARNITATYSWYGYCKRFTTTAMTSHGLLLTVHVSEHLSPLHPQTRGAASLRHSCLRGSSPDSCIYRTIPYTVYLCERGESDKREDVSTGTWRAPSYFSIPM